MTESSQEIPVQIMTWDRFQAYCSLFDKRLPENATHDAFEAQLTEMQSRFRRLASEIGTEGDDWELSPIYGNVLVFYVYLSNAKMYTPKLMEAISNTMTGFDELWIAELECFDPPMKPGGITFLAFHNRRLLAADGNESLALVSQLTEDRRRTKR